MVTASPGFTLVLLAVSIGVGTSLEVQEMVRM
jgi:hypothetical protein